MSMILPKPWLFLHIPKTGGTTLSQIVRNNIVAEDFLQCWKMPNKNELPTLRNKKVIFGHLFYGIHELFSDRCTYITVVRKPVERVLSHFYYHLRTPTDPFHRAARDNSFEDWVRGFVDAQNLQVQILSGQRGPPTRETLEIAQQNLREFGIVGTLERFDETLSLLRARLGFERLDNRVLQSAPNRPTGPEIPMSVRQLILEHNQLDAELYDTCERLLEAQLAEVANCRSFEAPQNRLESSVAVASENQASPTEPRIVEVQLRIVSRKPLKLRVKPHVDRSVSGDIAIFGVWEAYNTALLQGLLDEGNVFLDVGAHVGYFTIVAADLVGKTGRVLAFEPEPENADFCEQNVTLNGFDDIAQVYRCAIGDEEQTELLYRARDNHGAHQLTHMCRDGSDRCGIPVRMTSLDRFAIQQSCLDRVDCIKMDVQGYETKALLGMRDLIKRNRDWLVILVEFSPDLLQRFDDQDVGLKRFLELLRTDAETVYLVRRQPSVAGGVSIDRIDGVNLEKVSQLLSEASQRDDEDRCVDLLLVFTAAARERLMSKSWRRPAKLVEAP